MIGHSYMGLMVALHAMQYGATAHRIVQIAPMQPHPSKEYPKHLTNHDSTFDDVLAGLGELQKERASLSPTDFCRKSWTLLRRLYVANPAHADKIHWDRCDLANEPIFMKYWTGTILPSIQAVTWRARLAKGQSQGLDHPRTRPELPVRRRQTGRRLLPTARLLTVDNRARPVDEAPGPVFDSIRTFLAVSWPRGD